MYKDANKVLKCTDVPDKLIKFKHMMEEKPRNRINEREYDTSQKIYEKNQFIILKVKSKNKVGFIVYNKNKTWDTGHTHLNSLEMAKTIIKDVIKNKKPKTTNTYLLRSHIRLSENEKYISYLEQLIEVRSNKSYKNYLNWSKGVKK